ncbi:ATP-grasp domain-containing protein [Thiohalophilus thiocyanatoxydans]|uniref:ATP-grasp domain-containing protein n=1 Tax=Thiohalophilus thiocyanatoxydans TaxID=381308 RepID=A0A4R8IQG1_9GAMM|nr:ATP-grasp domain-containing protein [Thiohalophilus thiocyanatoxydans]TDX99322.1 ATP-grasp domain-containing protein [Thiohalophilus thiocyanatoxydans]
MVKNIFVVGADEFNCKLLEKIHGKNSYEFHNLLTFDEVKGVDKYPSFDGLIEQAEFLLGQFEGTIDAIVGYWDFPVNSMVSILSARHNLLSPSLESELKCDHKYWSRCEQKKVIPRHTPDFEPVDPFDQDAAENIQMAFPFWIKPVKSTDSFLAFRVDDRQELDEALGKIRDKIAYIGVPFNELLAHVTLPDYVREVEGHHCIIEKVISGHQCTVEGNAYEGEINSHGIIDSFNYPGSFSFFRYEYPSQIPDEIKDAMVETSRTIMSHIGFDNGAFNIEYFYDMNTGQYALLEINPRISQSHSEMFQFVDGTSNHQIMVDLALGNKPDFRSGAGQFDCAAKFYLRRFADGKVSRVPYAEELDQIRASIPGIDIEVNVEKGTQLSRMIEQDSYSFDLANIYVGAGETRELLEKFRKVVEVIPIEIEGEDSRDWKQAALRASREIVFISDLFASKAGR